MFIIKTTRISHLGEEVTEHETNTEDACRFLHSLAWNTRAGKMLLCESDKDKEQLVRTYYDMYHDEFNTRHYISDEEQRDLQIAYPAVTDVFYTENIYLRFEAGIRELDPRYRRINTHQTIFTFQVSPLFECVAVNSAQDEQTKAEMKYLQKYIIYKHEQLNHLSYEDAREYLEQVWSAYQELFQDSHKGSDIERIMAINKNFDLPWYKKLYD